jgi:hypothetical protein
VEVPLAVFGRIKRPKVEITRKSRIVRSLLLPSTAPRGLEERYQQLDRRMGRARQRAHERPDGDKHD